MIIVDTNVLSALARPEPEAGVLQWLDRQPELYIWITSVTLIEIRYGLQSMTAGRGREQMTEEMEAVLKEEIGGRYLFFDVTAAEQAAELMALRRRKGRPVELRDTMIAGIVLASNATLATRNTSHFEDLSVPVVNPWTA